MPIWLKFFLTYLLVLVVAVGALSLYVGHEMDQHYLATLESSLTSQARLIAEVVPADLAGPQRGEALNATAHRLGRENRLRVTVIAHDGTVLADSEHDFRSMDNHAARPEFRQALASGEGRAIRYSRTLRVNMLYVAVSAGNGGVVRVAVPLRQVDAAMRRIRAIVLWAAVIALLLAVLLSVQFARSLGGAIGELSRAARSLAGGNLDTQVRVRGTGELAALAGVFNGMAIRLRTMVGELSAEKAKVETILERMGEAVLVTDAAGRIAVWNLEAERIFGIPADRALGRTVVDATQNHALDEAFRAALTTNRTSRAEVQLLFPAPRVLEATVSAIAADTPLGVVAMLHDVTELRRLEAVRREFVANASHELQTPITAIKAMAETLLAGGREDPALTERFLRDLEAQASRLGALVRDLLVLASLEAEPVSVTREPVPVAEVVAEALAEFRPLAEQGSVTLESTVPPDAVVTADPNALRRILSNLLDNAVKYTESGGRAGVLALCEPDTVAITVWDTGIGIPSTDLPRIFERFYRVDKARSRTLGGTGLGLSIVKHLVETLGGQVSVESELGKGSRFTVFLPAADGP